MCRETTGRPPPSSCPLFVPALQGRLTLWNSKRKYEKQAHPAAHIKLLKNSRKNREKVPVAAAQIMRGANVTLAHSHIRAGGESLSPFFVFLLPAAVVPAALGRLKFWKSKRKRRSSCCTYLNLQKPRKNREKVIFSAALLCWRSYWRPRRPRVPAAHSRLKFWKSKRKRRLSRCTYLTFSKPRKKS